MGHVYLNGELYGDLPCIPTVCPPMQDGGAWQETLDRLERAGRQAVRHRGAVNTRARRFIAKPWVMDGLYPDLSFASGRTMVAIAALLIEREEATPRRWTGFGGENELISARAVMLLGRALRREERRAS